MKTRRGFKEWYYEITAGLSLSFRTRVILSYLIIVGIAFFYLTRKMSHDVHPRYLASEQQTLSEAAELLSSLLGPTWGTVDLQGNLHGLLAKDQRTTRLSIVAPTGELLLDSSPPLSTTQHSAGVLQASAPILHQGETVATLTLSKPLTLMQSTKQRILLLGTAAAAGVVLMGIIFSAWLTYPIRNLIRYARSIRDGERITRPHLGHSEMRTLGLAFEEMRDALEGKDYVNRYVQTLTHEIKSPIAAIQGAAELLQEEMPSEDRRRFLENIQTESNRIRESVDNLLLLASVESKKSLDYATNVDLRSLLEKISHQLAIRCEIKAIKLTCTLPHQSAYVLGDAFLLERALLNLIENAIAFTPEEGCIAMILKLEETHWQITIKDTGPGIPDYALPRVFERFYSLPRPDSGRKSSGLGLAFVHEVVQLHSGTIALTSPPSGGTLAVMTLRMAE